MNISGTYNLSKMIKKGQQHRKAMLPPSDEDIQEFSDRCCRLFSFH
jgi:hypothetical protein